MSSFSTEGKRGALSKMALCSTLSTALMQAMKHCTLKSTNQNLLVQETSQLLILVQSIVPNVGTRERIRVRELCRE